MADKAEKMKARLPRGFVDRTADDIRAVDAMMRAIREKFELYGFEPVEQPFVEYTDALGKFLPDQDRPNEGVFSFQDDDEQWLSLRYDLTAPLARYVAENFETLPKPYRSYRSGWVFRNEKPGPGRFRQFMQFDADIVGTPGVAADAEMAMMMADTLEAVGIKRGDYVIRVNNRKVLDGVLEAIGLGGEENAGRRLTVLRAIDKLDKFGPEGVKLLLGEGRKDESGDFTKGAGLRPAQIELVSKFLTLTVGNPQTFRVAIDEGYNGASWMSGPNGYLVPHYEAILDIWERELGSAPELAEGIGELRTIAQICNTARYADRIDITPAVVRGLEYYTGPVYEAELLFEVPNEKGEIVRFGSVAGGGRYDGLVSRFRGEPVPATGFSIGVSRLTTALKNLGKLNASDVTAPVVVLVMDRDTESLGRYQKMVTALREAGIRAEMYLGGSGMKAQMKYADRRGAPCVIIQGGDEREKGEVQIKDLIAGAKAAQEITDNTEWRESRPAQFSVKEDELVAAVQGVLAGQAADRA
ncbi:MAG: histidine--tRNA ligase [Rhizobiaceae bacterium]|nr:histidine--tRNA ligase [Rhizobiaceae bacterium]